MGKWLQSNEHLTFEVRERVARITLNRPDRRNALSWEMLSELRAALLEADDLRSVSVIVISRAPSTAFAKSSATPPSVRAKRDALPSERRERAHHAPERRWLTEYAPTRPAHRQSPA